MITDEFVQKREFINQQKTYCGERGVPMFLPEDGKCFAFLCGADIAKHFIEKGIRGNEIYITKCPVCNSSFCD